MKSWKRSREIIAFFSASPHRDAKDDIAIDRVNALAIAAQCVKHGERGPADETCQEHHRRKPRPSMTRGGHRSSSSVCKVIAL